jgi:hypothetical protein
VGLPVVVNKIKLTKNLSKIAERLDFCCLYNTQTEVLDRLLLSSKQYDSYEVGQMIEEISLSAIIFNHHEGRLGNLHHIIGNFDNLCIGTFTIHDNLLLIIGIDKKKLSDNESDFILREISRMLSSEENN